MFNLNYNNNINDLGFIEYPKSKCGFEYFLKISEDKFIGLQNGMTYINIYVSSDFDNLFYSRYITGLYNTNLNNIFTNSDITNFNNYLLKSTDFSILSHIRDLKIRKILNK